MSRRGSVLEGVDFRPMTYEGQHRAAQDILQSRELELREKQLNQQGQKQKAANLEDTQKWIDKNFDPNKNLSGNPLADPTYNKKMAEINMKAYDLAAKGADINTIKMLLGPDADTLTNYSMSAKSLNDKLDKELSLIPNTSGYRKDVLKKKALGLAMLDDEGNIKNNIDPTKNYISEVLSQYPLETTTNEGLQEFVKNAQINAKPDVREVKTYNNRGGYDKKKLKITAPDWMELETDEKGNSTGKLVPRYEIATDDGEPIVHTFKDKDGKEVKAPVRMVDKGVFDMVLKSSPSYSDNLRGRVIEAIKSGEYRDENGDFISPSSPQADMLRRALVYDDLKMMSKGGVEEVVETKPTQLKVTNISGSGKGDDKAIIRNVFKEINDKSSQSRPGYGFPLNSLSATAQGVVLKYANELTGGDLTQSDVYVRKEEDGTISIVGTDNKLIAPMDFADVNIKVQPGVKEKREVIQKSKEQPKQKTISLNTLKSLVGKHGYEGYSEQEIIDYYKSNGYIVK